MGMTVKMGNLQKSYGMVEAGIGRSVVIDEGGTSGKTRRRDTVVGIDHVREDWKTVGTMRLRDTLGEIDHVTEDWTAAGKNRMKDILVGIDHVTETGKPTVEDTGRGLSAGFELYIHLRHFVDN